MGSNEERALSVAAVLDLSPDEELGGLARELWHGAEPSLDVSLCFSTKLAAKGILPAIDVDSLLQPGFPPPYHPPLLRLLRGELAAALLSSRELGEKLDLKRQLQLHAEVEDEEISNTLRTCTTMGLQLPMRRLLPTSCGACLYRARSVKCTENF
ncbi:unnamed protein product [Prorocentrum cordatum]|uniref:Uncharacterized protein n=1 Tax=Prorocentrum cordatum TaxID=2364126 RepID=A0ABN9TUD4_9DINO|nr:unnamed protein product [Polarella glacialis]